MAQLNLEPPKHAGFLLRHDVAQAHDEEVVNTSAISTRAR
jgi:hypothetical protein